MISYNQFRKEIKMSYVKSLFPTKALDKIPVTRLSLTRDQNYSQEP